MSRQPDFPGGEDLELTAAAWVFRRDAGLTSDEAAEFDRWQDADPRHRATVVRQTRAWSTLDRPRQAGQARELWQRLATRESHRRRRARGIGMALVASIAVGVLWHTRAPEQAGRVMSLTAVIMPERKTLSDGSRVDLKSGAEIAVDFNDTFRRVVLKRGEAHFEVNTNDRPFIVAAGQVEFRAVGTSFAIQIEKSEVALLVTEGQVVVEKAGSDSKSRVAPPSVLATVGARNRMVVGLEHAAPILPPTVVPLIEIAERLAWRAPRLEFTDTPLSEALQRMNQYNQKQFVIHDAALRDLQVTGLFRADRTESFVRLLEANFGVRAEHSGDIIGLRRKRQDDMTPNSQHD